MPSPTDTIATVSVDVHGGRATGPTPQWYRFWNTSLRFAPSPDILRTAANRIGRPKMIRAWLTLDEMYDYRDDSYHFNYRIGRNRYREDDAIHWYDRKRSAESEVDYQDYLDAVSAEADELLLCFRRYEHEAFNGVLGFAKYREVLKTCLTHCIERAPNITTLEVCNEWAWPHFGGLDHDRYWQIYREACRIAAELTDEMCLGEPLKVSGPASATDHFDHVGKFLRRYSDDADPARRLDAITLHDYSSGGGPARVLHLRARLNAWLAEHGLPGSLPVWVTEMGLREGRTEPDANLQTSAGVPALLWQMDRAGNMVGMPWCLHHDPDVQLWGTQTLPDGRLTPAGVAMELLGMHRGSRLDVENNGVDSDGNGVYALATADTGQFVVHLWNYADTGAEVDVRVTLPAHLATGAEMRVESFRLDATHNNALSDASARPDGLDVQRQVLSAGPSLHVREALPAYGTVLRRMMPVT
jgi:hypothetical protein